MGYFISGHFLQQEPKLALVRAALPRSIGCRVLRHQTLPLFGVDTFRVASPPGRWPFAAATPATDLPAELPATLSSLSAVYERLRSEGVANGLKRSYINLSCLLSGALRHPVLTVYSDDDGNDFACLTRPGALVSLAARCGDYVVRFAEGGQASLEAGPEDRVLHALAAEHLQASFGIDGAELGMCSFEPPEAYGFEELATLH
jgi:hypothetical protein